MAPAMRCKTCKKSKTGEIRCKTDDFKSKFACILEASESTRMRMEESLPKYHEDHIAGKGDNSLQYYIWYTKIFLCLKQWRYPQQKQQWIKNGRNLKSSRRGTKQKSEVNQRWLMNQEKKVEKYTSLHWWTSVIWRMPNWRQSTKNTKVELCFEATFVKDDSGSYAVFTEQGSSASQMTAAKVMDIISRLPGCSGQAADAVSAVTQVKMEDAPKLLKIPKSECPDNLIRLPRHKWPKWKTQSFLLNDISTVIVWQDCLCERLFEKVLLKYGWDKVSKWECLFVHRSKNYSYRCMWMTSNWLERKIFIRCGKYSNKEAVLGEPESFLDHENLGCTQKTMWNKQRYCGQLQNHVWIQNFRRSNGKISMLGKSEYLFMVLWHGGSCQEMCGTVLWVSKQNDSTTRQSINSLHWWPWNPWDKCWYLARIGRPDILWSVNKTYTIHHKMNQSVWQTIISFDLLHSSYKWIQTILPCGKHCKTMQNGTVSRLRLCRRSWGLEIYFRWNSVHFWKPHVRSNQLDV